MKLKIKVVLLSLLLMSITILPFAIKAQDEPAVQLVDAGPDQTVYVNQTIYFNGNVAVDLSLIVSIEWDFGDESISVNGSDPALLNTTHVYTAEGAYNATLSVKFNPPINRTETDTAIITVLQNLPPVANAGPDQVVEQTSPIGAEVTLNASEPYDPYGDPLTYTWTWNGGSATGVTSTAIFPPGTTTVTLTVSDGQFNATDAVNITVQDTTPPIVNAGPDVTMEQESYARTQVTLFGTVTDAASTQFNFTWSEGEVVLAMETNASNTTLTYTFNLGVHIITLTATDEAGNTASDNVTVTIVDTTPPQITATATPNILWPPNHKYVEVKVTVTVNDTCDPSPNITLVSITSNEPDNSKGDGNTVDDIVIIDDFTFKLRAERSGTGSARIYTITYKAMDASGNYAMISVTIEVPYDK